MTGVNATTGVFQVTTADVTDIGGRDFYPTSSSLLINAGSAKYSPRSTYDFNGTPRSASTPTVGAYVRAPSLTRPSSLITPHRGSTEMKCVCVVGWRDAGVHHGDQPRRCRGHALQVWRLVQHQTARQRRKRRLRLWGWRSSLLDHVHVVVGQATMHHAPAHCTVNKTSLLVTSRSPFG
jgi:hypothetical protein